MANEQIAVKRDQVTAVDFSADHRSAVRVLGLALCADLSSDRVRSVDGLLAARLQFPIPSGSFTPMRRGAIGEY